MPRLRNDRTGVVVNVDDDTAARLRSGSDDWASTDEEKAPAKKSASSKSSKSSKKS